MVRNIIEDSDDEGDFGALSPIASRPASPTPPDAPDPDAPTHIQRTAPATSSTEELRRDIAAAHQEVLDKSALPNGTVNSVNGSGHWSSPVASRKRKAALLSLESNGTPSSERPEPRKTNKTYGNSDRMGHSFFDDNNDVFEAMKEEETARTSGYNGVSIQPHETSETWYMVGNDQAVLPEMAHSLQEDFVLHDPAVMFPTTMSSTIPDATISQQQLVEAARAEYRQNQLGSRNLTAKILENPSVSWSDCLESTEKEMRSSQTGSGKSQQQFQRSSQPTNTQSSQRDKYGSDGTKDDAFASPATVKSKKSTRRSKTTPHPRLSQSSHDELGDEAFPAESMSSSKRPNPSIEGITASQRAIDDSVKESIRAVRASKAAKAKVQESSDALNSDDLAIGLPKERYVPRPSRSRSERSTVEEPDYSMIPEKAAKAKGKRQKTVEPLPEDPKEIESVGDGDSGNRVLQEDADRELNDLSGRKHKSDQDEDVVITGGSASVRPVQKNTPAKAKRKRGRPPKTSPIEALGDAIAENNTLENTQLGDVDELQQVMPLFGSGHDVDPHSAHKEQLLHDPDFTEDATRPRLPSPFVQPTPTSSLRKIEEEGEMQLVETKAKKKGRGRPRSAKNAEAGATNVDKPKVTAEDPPHDEEVKSQEIQPNTKLKEERSHDDQKIAEGGEAERGAQSDAAAALGPSGSPKQPSEEHEVGKVPAEQRAAASRESVQPSPLGKGKVPVRVGLSRRARIAPLLKIVKK